MLVSLSIKNFILIDTLHLEFGKGLCLLSGETGAGKSIILEALALVLGERANTKLIKDETHTAIICAEFDIRNNTKIKSTLVENGFDDSNDLLLKRTLEPSGKTKCFINDTVVSLNLLEKISVELIEISNQHDQKGLFNQNEHRMLLDEFSSLAKSLEELSLIYAEWKALEDDYSEVMANEAKSEGERGYLQHIVNEISELKPIIGEEKYLNDLRSNLREKTKIQEITNVVINEAKANIVPKINTAIKALNKMPSVFQEVEKYFESALIELNEGIVLVEKVREDFEENSLDLSSIEERLFSLQDISKKYLCSIEELPDLLTKSQAKLDLIVNYSKSKLGLEEKILEKRMAYIDKAKLISKQRQESASLLKKLVQAELKDLKMSQAEFEVEICELSEEEWSKFGMNKIRFLARTNPGSKFGAINSIASGGELSRLFLSLKLALAKVKSIPTIIFDEIDVGVGGAVADSIGKKLSILAKQAQLLVITHQPQVACYSDHHYLVSKKISGNKVSIEVQLLTQKEKLNEVARMLSGAMITKESILAAETLINKVA